MRRVFRVRLVLFTVGSNGLHFDLSAVRAVAAYRTHSHLGFYYHCIPPVIWSISPIVSAHRKKLEALHGKCAAPGPRSSGCVAESRSMDLKSSPSLEYTRAA